MLGEIYRTKIKSEARTRYRDHIGTLENLATGWPLDYEDFVAQVAYERGLRDSDQAHQE